MITPCDRIVFPSYSYTEIRLVGKERTLKKIQEKNPNVSLIYSRILNFSLFHWTLLRKQS